MPIISFTILFLIIGFLILLAYRAGSNNIDRLLKNPKNVAKLYDAFRLEHQRRAQLRVDKAKARLASPASQKPPKGKIPNLLYKAHLEGERLKAKALKDIDRERL